MPMGRFRITNPTLALVHEDGRHVAHTVPTGTIIVVDSTAFDDEKLVNVTWDSRKVMMFAQDLRVRAERVASTSE
jgi:hypothetical protein